MKYNRAVFMTFTAGTSTASVNINVPIQVKRIHCKSVGYITSTPPASGDAVYGFVISDLTQNQPIAMFYGDSTYPYATGTDIEFEYQNPQPVQGSYTFRLMNLDGSPFPATTGNDSLGMILEFNDEDEKSH